MTEDDVVDWGCDVDSMLQHFGTGALDKIEQILGCASPNEIVRVELALIAWKYATGRSNLAPEKDLKAWFKNLQEGLTVALSALNPPSNAHVADTIDIILEAHNIHPEFDRLRNGIEAMLEKTARISCGPPASSKGGRPPQTESKVMISRCAELFGRYRHFPVVNSDVYHSPAKRNDLAEGTANEYGGKFFHLVEAVDVAAARVSGRNPGTNGSLGSMIVRTLKEISVPAETGRN